MNLTAWQCLALSDVTPTPWRNGGGVTRELLCGPTPEAWRWRLSVADVARDGPFSCFEQTQRWFAVLDGAGVVLRFPDQTHHLHDDSPVLSFSGESPCDCALIDGSTLDFNLMTRGLPAQMLRLRHASESFTAKCDGVMAVFSLHDNTHLEHAPQRWTVPRHTLAWRPVLAKDTVRVHTEHALMLFVEGAR